MQNDHTITDPQTVKVRYWKADASTVSEKKTRTGHVSLQTQLVYASFWPHETKITSIQLLAQNDSLGCFPRSPAYDIAKYNGRQPDETIELKTLNVTAINEKLLEIKAKGTSYHGLLGSSPIRGRTLNCCSLVYALLKAGSQQKPIEHKFSSLDPQCKPKYYLMLASLSLLVGGGLILYWKANSLTDSQNQQLHNDFRADAIRWMEGKSVAKPLSASLQHVTTTTRTSTSSLYKFGVAVTGVTAVASLRLDNLFRKTLTPQNVLKIAKDLREWEGSHNFAAPHLS